MLHADETAEKLAFTNGYPDSPTKNQRLPDF
jgi:hypothetical protein